MEEYSIQKKKGIYNHHFIQHKKKSMETTETSDILPSIQPVQSIERQNVARNHLNQTRSQIILMQAKLQALNKLKDKYERKKSQNMTQLQFANSVKERALNDAKYKQKINEQKQQHQQFLKQQTGSIRQTLINERKNAQTLLLESRMQEADEERRRRKQEEYLLKKLKELEMQKNEKKAEQIRDSRDKSASRIKDFQQSRVTLAKDNYKKKVLSTLKAHKKAASTLQQMKEEQERLLTEVKATQKAMLTSLYHLDTMNPEKGRRRFQSDKKIKYDPDEKQYQEDNFEP